MNTVEETIEVAVPVRTAYNQWTQFEGFPRFSRVVRRIGQLTPSVTAWVVGVGPLRKQFEAEIVEQIPDSHVAWRSLDHSPWHEGEVSFRALAQDRTAITVRMRIRRRGAAGVFTAVPGAAGRVVRQELACFKEFIEGLGEAGGGWRGTIRKGHVRPGEPERSKSQVPTWPVG
ncbi:SRPBCC family protein [Streptomyces sp. NPDC058378]|uniref:SRPBCC family protein n=1 Tax=Streptomyces sp. NPDC058378 TaxID=3346469 RepID=UPI003665BBD6